MFSLVAALGVGTQVSIETETETGTRIPGSGYQISGFVAAFFQTHFVSTAIKIPI